jgi:pyruvate carboxylase
MADEKPADAAVFDEEVFEEGEPQEAQTIHRIRANSTIMQLKKILGECR